MDTVDKIRPFLLSKVLFERTDEEHYLSTSQLSAILEKEYGITVHRQTIPREIELLRSAGMDIQEIKSTQNRYSLVSREFDMAELKLLIDAVESSKFITKKRSTELVTKLTKLSSLYEANELKRNLVVDGRIKLGHESNYITVDIINRAINSRKKILFQMDEYNLKKQKVRHNGGEWYIFSPYSLVWDGDNYYVVGWSDKYQSIGSHRVDRLHPHPQILDDEAVPAPKGFDINRYINTMFRMYNAPRKMVELICENNLMDAVVDRFGTRVHTETYDEGHFLVKAEVAVGTVFYNWIFGFRGAVKINAPEEVKEEYRRLVKAALRGL